MNTQNITNFQVKAFSGARPAPRGQVCVQQQSQESFGINTRDSFVPSQFAMQQMDDMAWSSRAQGGPGPQASLQAAEDFLWEARAQALKGGASSGSSQISAQAREDFLWAARAAAHRPF